MKNKYVLSVHRWLLLCACLLSLAAKVQAQNPLIIVQTVYNCTTGSVTFLTAGGNGSPITFSAPGIVRSSPTSTTGLVEAGLRSDPKPITIQATQGGQTASYLFDLPKACTSAQPPVLVRPIPDLATVAGQPLSRYDNAPITISHYFTDPNSLSSRYKSLMKFVGTGLPEGMYLTDFSTDDLPRAYIEGTPTVTGVYTVTVTASLPLLFNLADTRTTTTFNITVSGKPETNPSGPVTPPPTGGSLALTQPTYTCGTGAITFNTTGGNGSPITYNAPGISRTSLTSNSGTVEQGLRSDPKPITITAMQGGTAVSYTFDFGAYCINPQPPVTPPTPPVPPPTPPVTPPTGSALTLLAPDYDCTTGAITFRSSGGNSTGTPTVPIEYRSIGITDWTSNPNQFVDRESRTASDVKPFTLMARQNGVMVTYVWDLKAACGRARLSAGERVSNLSVVVLGNPVSDAVTVEVRGVQGQPLTLQLVDLWGRLLGSRSVKQAVEVERQRFELSQGTSPGLLLLRATSGSQSRLVKVLKQ